SAATALLTAPTSGRALRNQVRSQGMEWKQIIEDIIKDGWKLKDQIAQTSKEGAALINELTEEMKTSVDEWKNTVEPHQNNIHQYLAAIEASNTVREEQMPSYNSGARSTFVQSRLKMRLSIINLLFCWLQMLFTINVYKNYYN